jgi:putative transposase
VQAEDYFLVCQRYIELNPVRAGLVEHPVEFHWSSYKSNALGIESGLVKPHDIYLSLGSDEDQRLQAYRALFDEVITGDQITELRDATNKGLVFGSTAFKNEIFRQSGQRTRINRRGRKPLISG